MHRHNHQQDSLFNTDGLQADVMRFMAMIAFCLIAMMTLVPNVDYPTPAITPEKPAKESKDLLETSTPVTIRPPKPTPEAGSDSRSIVEIEAAEPRAALQQRQPLTLRFASEQAFLGLISAGSLNLYAQTNLGYLMLEPSFRWQPAAVSGELYEILATSLPRKVSHQLPAQTQPGMVQRAPRFFVRLPKKTGREIADLSQRYASTGGNLTVQSNGDVIYDAFL